MHMAELLEAILEWAKLRLDKHQKREERNTSLLSIRDKTTCVGTHSVHLTTDNCPTSKSGCLPGLVLPS